MSGPLSVLSDDFKIVDRFQHRAIDGSVLIRQQLLKSGFRCDVLDFDVHSEEEYLTKVESGDYDGSNERHPCQHEPIWKPCGFQEGKQKERQEMRFCGRRAEATLNCGSGSLEEGLTLVF